MKQLSNYQHILSSLKEKIRQARLKAALTVNAQLLSIYWEIGVTILNQQKEEGWGAKVIDKLALDLKSEFSDMKGLSVRNLKYMRAFAAAYPNFHFVQLPASQIKTGKKSDLSIVQPVVAQLPKTKKGKTEPEFLQPLVTKIPWTHHTIILDRIKDKEERIFYLQKTVENGWSKSVLSLQIDNKLFKRQGKAVTNFENTLPAIDSDLAKETFKSSYVFDFLTLSEEAKEKDVERALIQHLKKFMLELGRGFAYVGNQYNLVVEGDDYFLDLLFYHRKLKRLVAIDLKLGKFKAAYKSEMELYLRWLEKNEMQAGEKMPIGLILCAEGNKEQIELLQLNKSGIKVAEYLTALPSKKLLQQKLHQAIEISKKQIENNEQRDLK